MTSARVQDFRLGAIAVGRRPARRNFGRRRQSYARRRHRNFGRRLRSCLRPIRASRLRRVKPREPKNAASIHPAKRSHARERHRRNIRPSSARRVRNHNCRHESGREHYKLACLRIVRRNHAEPSGGLRKEPTFSPGFALASSTGEYIRPAARKSRLIRCWPGNLYEAHTRRSSLSGRTPGSTNFAGKRW